MPLARSEYEADPAEFTTTTGITGLAHATPATPMPLFVAAAATLATAVPWPNVSAVLLVPVRKFQPGTTLGARSGLAESTPESTTAIVMAFEPVDMSHALVA